MTKISIGLPIFNEEKFIANKLRNLLNQTFTDFEIIISDNASTDSTRKICEGFVNGDKRIVYFRQPTNQGWLSNFKKTLHEASSEFFVWTSADDLWDDCFLERALDILEKNDNIVCSIGKIMIYDQVSNDEIKIIDVSEKQYLKNFKLESLSGTYNQKAYQILHNPSYANYLYGLFKIEILKKSIDHNFSLSWDRTLILKIAKYGDLHISNDFFWYRYPKGMSMVSIIDQYIHGSIGLTQMLFPYGSFVKWCVKNLNKRIILKNLGIITVLSLSGFLAIGIAIFKQKNYSGGKKIKW